ncbi:MAG: hypothetical protein A2015_05565 [Spirochaetes bacterium GWF1_31_7]|nr:MAG: hypothetical protein A2Y30_04645 [Spirochaetes bacterium GWE1_32_154]OHD46359.1 MAG: hypothetical protein A2Y29_04360 [Spirochaetes bacterium GWE2_31_10]OHD52559.1 MAG: hypothetical protein A2015_05565 [Spirochaetes bacterium GWF1_31_7]OHD80643.1 MAG: hypothetical protein A2355_02500 [Spirochaetes bacterium RIFOXYB1_FULL_32_8]HBD93435.1 hypothetical protein [Spirochaetia bacterium]
MRCKRILSVLLFIPVIILHANELSFDIHRINGNSMIKIRKSDNSSIDISELTINDTRLSVFAGKDSDAQIIIYKDNIPLSLVLLKNGTDADIFLSPANVLTITSNYGLMRVITADETLILKSSKVSMIIQPDSDLSFNQFINNTSLLQNEIALFNGSASITNTITYSKESILPLEKKVYSGKNSNTAKLNDESILLYKNTISLNTTELSVPIITYLESLSINTLTDTIPNSNTDSAPMNSSRIYYEINDPNIESEAEIIIKKKKEKKRKKEKKEIDKNYINQMLLNLIYFEGAFSYHNPNLGARFGWYPEIEMFGNKFFMSFFFNVHIVPEEIINGRDPFYKVNGTNNEWSFGYEYTENTSLMVFDIIEDLFLKTGYVSFGYKESPFYLQAGNIKAKNDFASLRYFNYSPNILFPFYRTTSFDILYQYLFFKGSLYVENVATGGLFDISLECMTPSENFRLSIETSFSLETSDMRKSVGLTNYEMIAPLNFNNIFKFTIFNLPSFGYQIYASAGILFPFTLNNNDFTSQFSNLFNVKADNLLRFINITIGQIWRFQNFNISADTNINSRYSKTSLYSPTYFLSREDTISSIKSWYNSNTLESSTSLLTDLLFSLRLGMQYKMLENIQFQLYYSPGFNYDAKSAFTFIDTLLMNLKINYKINKNFQILYQLTIDWPEVALSILNGVTNSDYIAILNNVFVTTNLEFKLQEQVYCGGSFSLLPAHIKNSGTIDFNAQAYIGFNFQTKKIVNDIESEKSKL